MAPLAGAVIAGVAYRWITGSSGAVPAAEEAQDTRQYKPRNRS